MFVAPPMNLLDVVDLSTVEHTRLRTIFVERHRHGEFTLSRLGLSNDADVNRVLFVDGKQCNSVGASLIDTISRRRDSLTNKDVQHTFTAASTLAAAETLTDP